MDAQHLPALRCTGRPTSLLAAQVLHIVPFKIEFLCVGSGKLENGNVASTCADGETCIAGKCVDAKVDSSTLPDYLDKSALGDGSCLDVATCFDDGAIAAVDLASCTIPPTPGVNFALQTEGEGICGTVGCFIALDSDAHAPDELLFADVAIAHARLAEVAFHALPWDGGLLLDRAPLLYALDLPASAASSAACAGAPIALVVADAREDLAGAGSSAGALQAALASRGYTVRLLRGAEARVAPVSAALADPCVQLFHYEGHAVFQGRDGVDASLLLADGRLRAADVLRLPRVPRAAVLSGCSTAEASGLGLAQAFLARGAAQVLATTAPVDDLTAARVGPLLYAAPSPAGEIPPRLAEGWRAAFPRIRAGGADARDLRAYRVLGR